MKRIVFVCISLLLLLCLMAPVLHAEDESEVWTLVTSDGKVLTQIATAVTIGDEYIAGDNTVYKVVSLDKAKHEAVVEPSGEENPVKQTFWEAHNLAVSSKKVGLYCTHSDESYENVDGASSIDTGWAGIHDVASTLKSWLEDKGIAVDFNTDSFLPHDAGAYRRSRAAMMELVEKGPAAIFDIHRDGIPDPAEYETEVNGEAMTKVRLLVGRSNPNSTENKNFAVQLKSVADEQYPGLIKDIFIGKGNYNQELMPDSVLLEFGTHVSDKEQVLSSTKAMADVINITVFGGTPGYSEKANAEKEQQNAGGAGTSAPNPSAAPNVSRQSAQTPTEEKSGGGIWVAIAWIVGIVAVALLAFGVIANGGFSGFGESVKRFTSEVTGGLFGKKPKE